MTTTIPSRRMAAALLLFALLAALVAVLTALMAWRSSQKNVKEHFTKDAEEKKEGFTDCKMLNIGGQEIMECGADRNIPGKLFFHDITKNKIPNMEDNNSDPYYFEKIVAAPNDSHMRLTINDEADESFQIWGNSCAAGDCAGSGLKQHHFRADGGTAHAGAVVVGDANTSVQQPPNGGLSDSIEDRSWNFNFGLHALNKVINQWTHFPWKDGRNYIAGDTNIDGKVVLRKGNGNWNYLQVQGNHGDNLFVGSDETNRGIYAQGNRPLSLYNEGNRGLTVTPNGTVDMTVNSFAVANGLMAPGSLTIGDINKSFGGESGWRAGGNAAGLLLETQDNTEIAVHDAGSRVASMIHYQGGGANAMTLGRNMGWGPTRVKVASELCIGNTCINEAELKQMVAQKGELIQLRNRLNQNDADDLATRTSLDMNYLGDAEVRKALDNNTASDKSSRAFLQAQLDENKRNDDNIRTSFSTQLSSTNTSLTNQMNSYNASFNSKLSDYNTALNNQVNSLSSSFNTQMNSMSQAQQAQQGQAQQTLVQAQQAQAQAQQAQVQAQQQAQAAVLAQVNAENQARQARTQADALVAEQARRTAEVATRVALEASVKAEEDRRRADEQAKAAAAQAAAEDSQRDCNGARQVYLQRNQDVAKANMDPWWHYVNYGRNEGRKWPGKECTEENSCARAKELYLKEHPGLKAINLDPWEHFTRWGRYEGLKWPGKECTEDECARASDLYLQQNSDVRKANQHPWWHYVQFGRNEGRKWPGKLCEPLPENDCARAKQLYLEQNKDVANAKMEPWWHYSVWGRKEGRKWPGKDC
jgi:hypothetical protein